MKTRGGKRRMYKKRGRSSASKCYKQYCFTQFDSGLTCTGDGKWIALSAGDRENMRTRAVGYRGLDT